MNAVSTHLTQAGRTSARLFRQGVLATLSTTPAVAAILAMGAAPAQAAEAQTAAAPAVEEIIVTGTRVVRDGYEAPTPVSVITIQEMQNTATSNLADYVNTLPSISGSVTPTSTTTVVNGGNGAINGLNLRGLGTVRTLVLLNGQRTVGSINTGIVDVSELPQELISRVDVVTGGASAAYGSDALTGVVNFILDTKFTGVKGEASGGVTTYGDDRNWKISLSAGTGFAGGRGHFLISGEMASNDGIRVNNRPWNQQGYSYINNPAYGTAAGQSTSVPQRLATSKVALSNASWGGLITAGPLKGIIFGPGGSYANFNYGSLVSNPLMSGGDWRMTAVADVGGQSLVPTASRQSIFTRFSFQVTDDVEVYAQAAWAHSFNVSSAVPNFYTGNLVIKADNAFIPTPLAAQLAATKQTSFALGTVNGDVGTENPTYDRRVVRLLVGVTGKLDAFDTAWNWDAYYSSGFAMGSSAAMNTFTVANYMLAIDAVRNPTTGAIVCRSTLTAPTNGCVPYNTMGIGVNSAAAINYIKGGRPFYLNRMLQKVAAVSVNGEPFSTWAGPVSIATGVEHREESTRAVSDPGEVTGQWFISSGVPFSGKFTVNEGFIETVVPLAKDTAWAKTFELNGAMRATGYSTFGTTATWKIGVNYSPIDDLRFRGVRSKDIREPTLVDLFAAGVTQTNSLLNPFLNQTVSYLGTTQGNASLVPEEAATLGLGAVYQPSWFPGFSASFDYYDIRVTGAIASFNPVQLINLCYGGNQAACSTFSTIRIDTATNLPVLQFFSGPQNFAKEKARGFDIEASYTLPLDTVNSDWAGKLSWRGLATHAIEDTTTSGVVGSIPSNSAGQNTGAGPPKWRFQTSLNYSLDPISVTLTMRGLSPGKMNNNYVECTSGCPVSTGNNITVSNNQVAGATYFDINTVYKLHIGEAADTELFLSIRNLANKDPAVTWIGPDNSSWTFYPTSNTQFDVLGRVFRAGVRFKM